jgi:hypothetical protein
MVVGIMCSLELDTLVDDTGAGLLETAIGDKTAMSTKCRNFVEGAEDGLEVLVVTGDRGDMLEDKNGVSGLVSDSRSGVDVLVTNGENEVLETIDSDAKAGLDVLTAAGKSNTLGAKGGDAKATSLGTGVSAADNGDMFDAIGGRAKTIS